MVSAVVPNYNGRKGLQILLPQLLAQPFDRVYVIDDVSTDDSVAYIQKFKGKVRLIQGERNVGPGANRSRILAEKLTGIIFFIDADMDLQTKGVPQLLTRIFQDSRKDYVGFTIMTSAGTQMWWNYGYEMHSMRDTIATAIEQTTLRHWERPPWQRTLIRLLSRPFTYNLDISWGNPQTQRVDWSSEALFAIRANAFNEVSGFDPKMWYHADQDLCHRLRKAGYGVWYSPDITAIHTEIDTFGTRRDALRKQNAQYFYQKHR